MTTLKKKNVYFIVRGTMDVFTSERYRGMNPSLNYFLFRYNYCMHSPHSLYKPLAYDFDSKNVESQKPHTNFHLQTKWIPKIENFYQVHQKVWEKH